MRKWSLANFAFFLLGPVNKIAADESFFLSSKYDGTISKSCRIEECFNNGINAELENEFTYFNKATKEILFYPNGMIAFDSSVKEFLAQLPNPVDGTGEFAALVVPYYKVMKDDAKEATINVEISYKSLSCGEMKWCDEINSDVRDLIFSCLHAKLWDVLYVSWKIKTDSVDDLDHFEVAIFSNEDKDTIIVYNYLTLNGKDSLAVVVGLATGILDTSWFSFELEANQGNFSELLQYTNNLSQSSKNYWLWGSQCTNQNTETPDVDYICQPRDITDDTGYIFSLKETRLNRRSRLKLVSANCEVGASRTAYAFTFCHVDTKGRPAWAGINSQYCMVDTEDFDYVHEAIAEAMTGEIPLNTVRVDYLANMILELSMNMEVLSSENSEILMGYIGNLMNVNVTQEAGGKLIKAVDRIGLIVEIDQNGFLFNSSPTIKMEISNISQTGGSSKRSRRIAESVQTCNALRNTSQSQMTIYLDELIEEVEGYNFNRSVCVVYVNDSFFVTPDTTPHLTDQIFSYKLDNYPLENLSLIPSTDHYPVTFNFTRNPTNDPIRVGQTGYVMDLCTYWNGAYWDSNGCVNYEQGEHYTLCTCNHLTNFAALYYPYSDGLPPETDALTYMTYIFSIISITSCLITIIAHLAIRKHRTNQHKRILMNICVAIIGRDVFFLVVLLGFNESENLCKLSNKEYDSGLDYGRDTDLFPNEAYQNDYREMKLEMDAYNEFINCAKGVWLVAIAHYFVIALFAWVACEGIHLYFNVVAVLSRPRHKYLTKLSLIGWGMPVLLMSVGLLVEAYSEKHDGYKIRFSQLNFLDEETKTGSGVRYYLWLDYNIFLGTIIVPFAIIFCFNCLMFGMFMVAVINTQNPFLKTVRKVSLHLTRQASDSELKSKAQLKEARRIVQGAVGLLVTLGVSNILMFLMLNDGKGSEVVAHFFIVFNGLQGFWIFLFHALLKDDVIPSLLCPNRVVARSLTKKMSFPTETSSTSRNQGSRKQVEDFPTGLAYTANTNQVVHSPTAEQERQEAAQPQTKAGLQFSRSLPVKLPDIYSQTSSSIRRNVQFTRKHTVNMEVET